MVTGRCLWFFLGGRYFPFSLYLVLFELFSVFIDWISYNKYLEVFRNVLGRKFFFFKSPVRGLENIFPQREDFFPRHGVPGGVSHIPFFCCFKVFNFVFLAILCIGNHSNWF